MTEYLQGRQAIYEYLYMTYYNIPDARFIEVSKKFLSVFNMLGTETNEEIAIGAEVLSDYFKENSHKSDCELAERLNVAFTKLFSIGMELPQTENRWRAEEKGMADIIISISNYFADAGIIKPTEINVPIDSYSIELFYLYRTSRSAAESEGETRDKIIDAQLNFIKDHILCWTDNFTNAVIEKTDRTNFYHALAYLSNGFIKYDFSILDE